MKKVLIFVLVSLLLISVASAKIGLTSRAVEDLNDAEKDKICCAITPVVPEAITTYRWMKLSECVNEKDGEPIVGAHKGIVDNNLCETQDDIETECEQWTCTKWSSACVDGMKIRECNQVSTCPGTEKTPKLTKKCELKERLKIHQKQTECPEECTCSGSTIKCILQSGREMTIHAGESGNTIVQVKGENMTTNVILYKSDGKLYGVFKNNETKIVKMFPDQIKEKIRERTRVKIENENITLDDNGTYQYEAKKASRLLGFIPIKIAVKAYINSQTGEIIYSKEKWWNFLSKDVKEETIVGASCGTVTPGYNDKCCQDKGYDVWNVEKGECEFNSTE